MPQSDSTRPYDAPVLLRLAEAMVRRGDVPSRWREDAVSEYVCAAYAAGRSAHRGNPQAHQCAAGAGAVRNFIRREQRHERRAPGDCPRNAIAVSLSLRVADQDDTETTLAEILADPRQTTPEQICLRRERDQAVWRSLRRLRREDRRAAFRVWLRGQAQRSAAMALGINRNELRRRLNRVRDQLRLLLADYQKGWN